VISSTALYNAAKHKGLRGPAHPTYGTSFETALGQTSENAYSRNSQKQALTHCIENVRFRYTVKSPQNPGVCAEIIGPKPVPKRKFQTLANSMGSWVFGTVSSEQKKDP
jgi:hypothetical protein